MSAAEHEAAIAQLLAELGDTADAVADKLRAKGIKGQRSRTEHCPISLYLGANGWAYHCVGDISLTVGREPTEFIHATTPLPVSQFINRFDRGVYLDLVEVGG